MDRRVIEGDESMDLGADDENDDQDEEEHNNQAADAGAAFVARFDARARAVLEDARGQINRICAPDAAARDNAASHRRERLRALEAASERLEEQQNLRERLARNAERVLGIAERYRDALEEEPNHPMRSIVAAARAAARASRPANAAAAAPPPNEEPSLLEQLMGRIRIFLSEEDELTIDEEQARSVLEASAGDLDIAASLYCDHYFATIASRRNGRRPADDNEESSPRRVRRRLEQQLEEHVADNDEDMDEDEDEEQDAAPEEPDVPANQPPPDLPGRRAWADPVEGAPVSDDEGPQLPSRRLRRRRVNFRQRDPEGRNVGDNDNVPLPAMAPPLRNISDTAEQQREEAIQNQRDHLPAKSGDKNEFNDEDLIKDDWIFLDEDTAPPVRPPVAILWGAPSPSSESSRGNNGNDPPEAGEGANNLHNNVIAEDEDGVDSASSPRTGIYRKWLHSGFTSSTCCTGLVTKPPPDEEVSLSRWHQNSGSRNIAPPSYHCRGLTALLSVVTALIYSGASIQGPTVNFNAAREPFAELSDSERKRQFDSRLVDALSSLLLIAAQASIARKERALAISPRLILPSGASDGDKGRHQSLRRKLRLCPTCRWEDDTGTGNGSVPEGQTVKIATSYTSIEDIRSYVLSTMRSFTKKGGCALFLETIIRIHGEACVERMMRRARRKASISETNVLIKCVCDERQKKLQQMRETTSASNQSTVAPLDHSCTSIELVSLLLTGEVHSTFHGWSTGGLGIGILSNKQGEVGRPLMRPEKPVWILRGDTCYSVLWLDGSKEHSKSIARLDGPGTVFRLAHWQCWFGDRHKSGMRVITARGEWTPPVFSKIRADSFGKKTVVDQIMARHRERSSVVSSDEQGEDGEATCESHITREEIDRVKVHPDDEKYYPSKYRQWRFDMGKVGSDKVDADMKMGPVGSEREHWTPYFRLDDRQRMVAEMKVSPKINQILWTRWPGATIDRFTPEEDEEHPVV
jgi:hypothetical protein